MKLRVMDIPSGGLELQARSPNDRWYAEVVHEAFRDDYKLDREASVSLRFLKTRNNVSMTGVADIELDPSCDRCLESFSHHLSIPVELVLAPFDEVVSTKEEAESTAEDLSFAFYKGDTIDLKEMIREFLVLAVPIRYLCREGCKGICLQCGENLNQQSCSCRPPAH